MHCLKIQLGCPRTCATTSTLPPSYFKYIFLRNSKHLITKSDAETIFQAQQPNTQMAKTQQHTHTKTLSGPALFWQFELLQASDTNRETNKLQKNENFPTHTQPHPLRSFSNRAKYFLYYVYDSHLWPDFGLINAMLFVVCGFQLLPLWQPHDSMVSFAQEKSIFVPFLDGFKWIRKERNEVAKRNDFFIGSLPLLQN